MVCTSSNTASSNYDSPLVDGVHQPFPMLRQSWPLGFSQALESGLEAPETRRQLLVLAFKRSDGGMALSCEVKLVKSMEFMMVMVTNGWVN